MGRKYSEDDSDSDYDRRKRRSGHHNERRRDDHSDQRRRDDHRDQRRKDDHHRRREDYDDEHDRRQRRRRDDDYELEDFHHKASKPSSRKFPTKVDRSCTDIIFLILFILVVAFWVVIVAATYIHIDIARLINLSDSTGDICGYSSRVSDTKMWYVSFDQRCDTSNPKLECLNPTCVKKCPSKNIDYDYANETSILWDEIVCWPEDRNKILKLNGTERYTEFMKAIQMRHCDRRVYATNQVLTLCIPAADNQLEKQMNTEIGKVIREAISVGESFIVAVTESYPYMLGGLGLALILSLTWMVFMRYFAGIVIWVSVIFYPFAFGGLTGACAYMANYLKNSSQAFDDISDKVLDLGIRAKAYIVFAVLAGIFGAAFLIISLILLFLRKRIAVAVALIKQASRSIASLPTLVIFPIIPYILQILGVAAVVTVSFMIFVLQNEMSKDGGDAINRTCTEYVDIGNPDAVGKVCQAFVTFLGSGVYIHIYNVFAGLWLTSFVEAFNYMVVAHAVSRYFWTRKEEDTKFMAVGSAVGTSLRYHSGTLAFGSLILSILWPVRVAILTIQKLLYSMPVVLPIVLSFCTVTVDPILRYLNKNGYIMVAMYGKNFCQSAAKAFALIVRNILRTIVVTSVTDFLIFVSKLVISALTGIILCLLIRGFNANDFNNIHDLIFLITLIGMVAVASFIVTSVFFDVYRNIVDTLFLCFLEDKKIHDGSRQRPYRMPSELMKILNKKNYR